MDLPSGWKCDLVFINKVKELIKNYEGKELIKQVQAMCGIDNATAYGNIQAVMELNNIENRGYILDIKNGQNLIQVATG